MTENMILYYNIEKNYYTAYTAPYRGGSAAYKNNGSVTYSALPENKGRKMIINTGMRTDIPAFYSDWVMNRIREGYVLVRNPYRQDWITRYDLDPYGVDCNGCMTKETFEAAIGSSLDIPKKKTQRAECSCVLGNDIGAYDTCRHLCRYCYANSNRDNVIRNCRIHDPESPFLVGTLHEGETIHQAEQVSWIDNQLSFF